ncbi:MULTISPECIES: TubC N-terminal docking domain-related protein [Burkholderia]|uniref:TubC N-terminal docking domain-related protein n=1 Tax=Burkholderia TaxID=32008 RepID=UPI000B7A7579|nr:MULTISPECIES: hypothetical protein [Burkholderia]OXJ00035.1 hypothetical protein CFB41_12585 [Burkholderia sp. AU33803]PRD90676.1 hypothetical protein C6P88_20805 [Burkholderia contaminans]
MSIVAILSKARSLGIRLSVAGDVVKMKGPPDAIAAIKPEIAARKPEIMAYLLAATDGCQQIPADCIGALCSSDGGLYLPWMPALDPEQLQSMQRELFDVVDELAQLERWPDDDYDIVIGAIERQPPSTLRPDLAHFRERLRVARLEAEARQAASRRAWKFDR